MKFDACLGPCRKIADSFARWSLFIIFFWFGLLKVIGESPASPLVKKLFDETIGIMDFGTFIILFGLFEMLIGILFIIRGCEKAVIPLLAFHMATTIMPLFLLTETTWSGFFVPTMEGQYIIKNLAIIGLAMNIVSRMKKPS